MGARSYSKHRTQVSSSFPMETNYINPNDPDLDQDTPLSGAYIRNLVKQLTTCNSSFSSSSPPPPTPPKTHQKPQSNNTPHKKQVRRRLHTTKPYQERLLNMAEARKEIVTALKFHRASMKQQQQQQQEILTSQQHFQETNFFSSPPPPALVLPNQTLGLSLSSFQDLTSLDAAYLYTAADDATPALSPLSVLPDPAGGGGAMPTSSSADPSEAKDELQLGGDQQGLGLVGSRALGEVEMEELKSIGEMHEMEWNDTINLANSAWWFKFLRSMEFEQESDTLSPTDDQKFEQVVEFPTHVTTDGNFYPDFEFPCMNIEDIEGLDEEWLS